MSSHVRDPLTVLRAFDVSIAPSPEFTTRLRRRLESGPATLLPRPGALPYLTVTDAGAALDWYSEVFGASLVGEPFLMDDNRIGHAELALASGHLYLADEFPELGLTAPKAGVTSVSLMLPVPDTDAVVQRVRDYGAWVEREPVDDHGMRTAAVIDPFGHRWMLTGPC